MGVYSNFELLVNSETSFGEYGETGTPTYATKLPAEIDGITLEVPQSRADDAAAHGRLANRRPGHPDVRSGAKVGFTVPLIGLGQSGAATAPTNWQHTLLYHALGGQNVSDVGYAINNTSTVTQCKVDASGGSPTLIASGSIVRVGTKGDARGDAACAAVGTLAADTINLLNALPAAPTVGLPDRVYATAQAFYSEGAILTSKRFCAMHSDTGAQIHLFGCQMSEMTFTLPMGGTSGKGTVALSYDAANWRRLARTFPDAAALEAANWAPVAGGSVVCQSVGTTTRAELAVGELELKVSMPLSPIAGPPGTDGGSFQNMSGWTRTGMRADLRFRVPYDTAWETWWDTANASLTQKYFLFHSSATDSKVFGFFCPSIFPSGPRPSPVVDVNGQCYCEINATCAEGPTTTSEHTRSHIRFFWG